MREITTYKKKIAICLYGKVGSLLGKLDRIENEEFGNAIILDLSYLHWKKYIIDQNKDYKIDFYIHCWDKNLKKNIKKLFKPVKCIIEKQKTDFEIPCKYIFRYASRYYSMKKVCNLVEKNNKYDFIMISRIDIAFTEPIHFNKLSKKHFYIPISHNENRIKKKINKFNSHKSDMNFFAFSESYYISNPENIHQLSFIYDYLMEVCKVYVKTNIHTHNECGYEDFSKSLKKGENKSLSDFSGERCIKLMILINENIYNMVKNRKKLTNKIPKFKISDRNLQNEILSLQKGKICLKSSLGICMRYSHIYTKRKKKCIKNKGQLENKFFGTLLCRYCNTQYIKGNNTIWSSHWLTSGYIYELCYKSNTKLAPCGVLLNHNAENAINRPVNLYFRNICKHKKAIVSIEEYLKKNVKHSDLTSMFIYLYSDYYNKKSNKEL